MFTGTLVTVTKAENGMEKKLVCSSRHCSLPAGILFVKERDITVSGDTWTVASTLNIKHYDNIVSTLSDAVFSISDNATTLGLPIPDDETMRMKEELMHLRSMTDQLQLMLDAGNGSVRARRAIFDSVGTGLRYAFGTLDLDDFHQLNRKIGD